MCCKKNDLYILLYFLKCNIIFKVHKEILLTILYNEGSVLMTLLFIFKQKYAMIRNLQNKKILIILMIFYSGIYLHADPIELHYPNQVACHEECVEFAPVIVSLKQPALFKWVTGDTTAAITVCPEYNNSYKVTVTDADGQTAVFSASVSVAKDHLLPQPSIISPVCQGDRLIFTHPNYGFIGTYHWFGPNQFTSVQREFVFENVETSQGGRYGMYINYYDKCPTDTVYLDVQVSPDKNYFQAVDSIYVCNTFCALHLMGLVKTKLHPQVSGGRQPAFIDKNKTKMPTNIIWCSFVAQEGQHTIEIKVDGCHDNNNNPGAIVGIFADKEFTTLIASSDTCMKGVFKLPSSIFEPAKTYYVFADGCGGNICDVRVYTLGQTINKYCNDYVPMSMVTSWKYNQSNFNFYGEFWRSYQGDTTINGRIYRKINNHPTLPFYQPTLIREDIKNRRVYQYKPGFGEFLLYNFNLKAGDSFILPTTGISYNVFKVDSVTSNLGILKRWYFSRPGFGGFVYTECLGGNQLEFYQSVMVADPVYGLACAFSGCEPIIKNQKCEYPEPGIRRDTIQQTICAGETFMGYDSSGQYVIINSSESHCADISLLDLTVRLPDQKQIDTVICEGQNYSGFDIPGEYVISDKNKYGCDSMTIIHLGVDKRKEFFNSVNICEGSVTTIRNWVIDKSGIYADTIYNSRGCIDTLFSIQVEVIKIDSIFTDTTICEGERYLGFSESGLYTLDTINWETDCVRKLVLNLEVLPLTHPECISSANQLVRSEIKLIQNPVFGDLILESDNPMKNLTIYTLDGRIQKCFDFTGGVTFISRDLSMLPGGIYVAAVETAIGVGWIKLVLIK